MFKRFSYRLTGFVCFAMLISVQAHASQIPLGINSSHGVFVQEIWQGKIPFLCLANRSGKDQIIQVSRWRSRQIPADPLLQWRANAGSVRCHDARQLAAERLLEFKLVDGERLGLLNAPRLPVVENETPSAFSSFQGLNGVCPTPGAWLQQPSLGFQAKQPASVTLLTTVRDGDARIEFPVTTHLELPHLQLKSAVSSTLDIDVDKQQWSIKVGRQTALSTVHRIELELDVPAVTQPTMYLLSGRQRIAGNGWQCFVRGILVTP